MAGLSVPPAMPQRSILPRSSHSNSNAASKPRQGTMALKERNAKAATPAAGRKERVPTTRRVCSVSSCPNFLDPGWPWKRCKQCSKGAKAREMRNVASPYLSVNVACMSCYAVSDAVHINELKAGQPYLCGTCRERNTAFSSALLQPPTLNPKHPPALPRDMVMHNTSPLLKHNASSLGHGPPPVSQAAHTNPGVFVPTPPPPPQAHFLPMPIAPDVTSGMSSLEDVAQFVHPDHRYILGLPDILVPSPPSQIAPVPTLTSDHTVSSTSPTTPQGPAVKRVRLIMPHYSRTGAILAVLPEDLGMKRPSLSHANASNAPLPPFSAAETQRVAGSSSAPLAQIELYPLETPRKVSVTHTQDGSIKLKIPPKHTPPPIAPALVPTPSDKSPHAPRLSKATTSPSSNAPAPPGKKRKRAAKPASRICDSPGCENVIPPRFKGARCVECGFARWSTVFRERFDGIRAELIQAGMAGPAAAVKADPDPEEETPVVETQPAAEEGVSSAACMDGDLSRATILYPERESSTARDGRGASSNASTALLPASLPPHVSRKPSIRSVTLIVSPRETSPTDSAIVLDPTPSSSSSRTDTPPSGAVDVPQPKIKSIKLRVSAPPDSRTTSIDIPAADTSDTPHLTTASLAHMDTVEDGEAYPMNINPDQESLDGDTTDSEASIPQARWSAARDAENTSRPTAPDATEAGSEYPMCIDHDLEDYTRDTTESEASVLLAGWSSPQIPSTTPRSASLPSVRRVRLILGPNPSRALSSSRESSPELVLSSNRPFNARRRWEELGWDTDEFDLTPLEESSDEGESEIDLPESSDEGEDGDGTRLSIDIPRRTERHPKKHRWQCATARCANLLAHGSFFKHCAACRKRSHLLRKREKKRDHQLEDAVPDKYYDLELEIPPDADLTGYRRCGYKRCNHLIPPESQYRFQTCGPCRAQSRKCWRKLKGLEPPECEASRRKNAGASIMERAIANAVRTAAKEEEEGPATGKRKLHAVDDARTEDPGAEKLVTMPQYQHFAALLEAMRARFSQFKAVQARYVQLKALTGTDSKPMVFNFDGEYSVVTDPSGGSVDDAVNTVIRNVQAGIELHFQPAGVHSGPEESVIASLSGAYVAKIPQLSKNEPVAHATDSDSASPTEASIQADADANASIEVTMAGELHICVAWDRRHKFFPGQRVMLRFRLVG